MLCGIVLMGGRSVIGRPLRALNLCHRNLRHEPAVFLKFPRVDPVYDRDVRAVR